MDLKTNICPHCGANLKVNNHSEYVTCEYCGSVITIDASIKQHDDAESMGYEFEKGRQKAKVEYFGSIIRTAIQKVSRNKKLLVIIPIIIIIVIAANRIIANTNTYTKSKSQTKTVQFKEYEAGQIAKLQTKNGSGEFSVIKAIILPERSYRNAVYQVTWVYENKTITDPLGVEHTDLKVTDSDGYVLEHMSSAWEGDWQNSYVSVYPGDKCETKHTFVIHDDSCEYLNVAFPAFNISFKVPIEKEEVETEDSELIPNEVTTNTDTSGDDVLIGNKNALLKAKDYLSFTYFSHDGLKKQLEYDGFTSEEALYGADNCGADWNDQAVKKAKDYMSFTYFSHDGLIRQLEYDGFTSEEAAYGADSCGADWNDQAIKKAKDYLSFTAFSHDGLIRQLEYDGFTSEEAAYGVENCNADWNEQAVKKAKEYLSFTAFSKNGLREQLEFDGFSTEEAEYGVEQVYKD